MENIDYQQFLTRMNSIYEKIKDGESKIHENGVTPLPVLRKGAVRTGGYFVALRHPNHINEAVEEISAKIANLAPSVLYKGTVHTSYAASETIENFQPDEKQVTKICKYVANTIKDLEKPSTEFREWLITPDSVIVSGIPNMGFVEALQELKKGLDSTILEGNYKMYGKEDLVKSYKMNVPVLAHMTASRATDFRTGEELRDIGWFDTIKNAPRLGLSNSTAVDVGYWIVDDNWSWHPIERINLK